MSWAHRRFMKKGKIYNDLPASIYYLSVGLVGFLSTIILFTIGWIKSGKTIFVTILLFSLGSVLCIAALILIIRAVIRGFDYGYILHDSIHYKKTFRKEVEIKLNEIVSVELSTKEILEETLECYVIRSHNKEIFIQTERIKGKQCLIDLEKILSGYLTESNQENS